MTTLIKKDECGIIFDIDTFALDDGPGIRTAVYLKGCPLACKWCHSPESLNFFPELIFISGRCSCCGRCADVCAAGVHRLKKSTHLIDRSKCRRCGQCAAACPRNALEIKGKKVKSSAVIERALRIKKFLDRSGGGITLTGGEVTSQPKFASAILAGCKRAGIHTAIETCGACSWPILEGVLRHTDLVLYDLKIFDEEKHLRWTGRPNRQILENAARITGRNVLFRIALIPGATDSEDNLRGICRFLYGLGVKSVELLPFNSLSAAKYKWLNRDYPIRAKPQNTRELEKRIRWAGEENVSAVIH